MLSQIAEVKKNVIFAMEEPETAIPPYAQKRIIHEVRNIASQSLFTSHSPYVLEEFNINEMTVLSRESDGLMKQSTVNLPDSIKPKRYRREFRTRFCEGLLSSRILIAEGATEATAMPAVALRLAELDSETYSSMEALGLCTIDAGGESNIVDIVKMYQGLGKRVFAICDKQDIEKEEEIKTHVEKLFMHEENGFENLIMNNTSKEAMKRYLGWIDLPNELKVKYPDQDEEFEKVLRDYLKSSKGIGAVADFLSQCVEDEIPEWIKSTCKDLKHLCSFEYERHNNDSEKIVDE